LGEESVDPRIHGDHALEMLFTDHRLRVKEFKREAFILPREGMGFLSGPEDVDANELPKPPDPSMAERGPESEN
jgi:hypothetical protein